MKSKGLITLISLITIFAYSVFSFEKNNKFKELQNKELKQIASSVLEKAAGSDSVISKKNFQNLLSDLGLYNDGGYNIFKDTIFKDYKIEILTAQNMPEKILISLCKENPFNSDTSKIRIPLGEVDKITLENYLKK